MQSSQDLDEASGYEKAADMLLFDAKAADLKSLDTGEAGLLASDVLEELRQLLKYE